MSDMSNNNNIPVNIKEQLEKIKPFLAKKYKVKEIGYFGSFASGNYSDSSDVDILIELDEPLGWEFFDLKNFLETHLKRPVDLVTRNALKKQLKEKILKQTIFV